MAYLVVALKEWASQDRPHPTMHAQAVTLSEQDMQDVAAYLSGQELKATGRAVGTAPKAGQTCVACHGNDGIGIMPEYPNLAGQHADYIEHSLKAYRAGQRKNAVMGGIRGPYGQGHQRACSLLLEPAAGAVRDERDEQEGQVRGAMTPPG